LFAWRVGFAFSAVKRDRLLAEPKGLARERDTMNREEKRIRKEIDLAIASVMKKRKVASIIARVLGLVAFVAWIIFFVIVLN
jgi:hypothetical protein